MEKFSRAVKTETAAPTAGESGSCVSGCSDSAIIFKNPLFICGKHDILSSEIYQHN